MSRDILVSMIDVDPTQPRKHFDAAKLDELAQSIAHNGLLSPILVRPAGDRFRIVHGERRFRAVQSLAWQTIAANVQEMSDEQARWAALVENVQRDDLTPIEEAEAYKTILETGVTQTQLADRVGKSQSYIATKLRLLSMPAALRPYLARGVLTEGHVKQLLRLRKFYADIPDRDISRDALKSWSVDALPTLPEDDQSFMFALMFNVLRPWDRVTLFAPEGLQYLCAAEGLTGLIEEVEDGSIPAWIVPAFWFAAFVAWAELSVSDTQTMVNNFMDLTYSNALISGDAESRAMSDDVEGEVFGRLSDLRHAGIQRPVSPEFMERARRHVLSLGSYARPSNYQPA